MVVCPTSVSDQELFADLQFLVPLAGLEPAACCLGDVPVQTLCRSAKFLVASDRGLKVILWCWRPFSLVGSRSLDRPPNQPPERRARRVRPPALIALDLDRAWSLPEHAAIRFCGVWPF